MRCSLYGFSSTKQPHPSFKLGSRSSLETFFLLRRKFASMARNRAYRNLEATSDQRNSTITNFAPCCCWSEVPAWREIDPWLRARWAKESQLSCLGPSNATVLMPATATLQLLEVPPLVNNSHELIIAILSNFSKRSDFTNKYAPGWHSHLHYQCSEKLCCKIHTLNISIRTKGCERTS